MILRGADVIICNLAWIDEACKGRVSVRCGSWQQPAPKGDVEQYRTMAVRDPRARPSGGRCCGAGAQALLGGGHTSGATLLARNVTQQGRRALPTIIAPSPGPAPPQSPGTTRSSPWPSTSREPSTARHGPAPPGRSVHTASRGHGSSGLGVGASPGGYHRRSRRTLRAAGCTLRTDTFMRRPATNAGRGFTCGASGHAACCRTQDRSGFILRGSGTTQGRRVPCRRQRPRARSP